MILIHQLKFNLKRKRKKRIGRGGKRGTYSGRGIKGQKARAGAKIKPQEREAIIKIPKMRGYRFKPIKEKPVVITLEVLNKKFEEGEVVSLASLKKKGLISKNTKAVKIVGRGELKKKLIFKGCQMSKKLEEKIKIQGSELKL